jgi:hypothetical protein
MEVPLRVRRKYLASRLGVPCVVAVAKQCESPRGSGCADHFTQKKETFARIILLKTFFNENIKT